MNLTRTLPLPACRGASPSPIRILAGVLVSLALSPDTRAIEVLSNGTLDAVSVSMQNNPTPDGWIVASSKTESGEFGDGASSEPWCNVADPGGYGLFFKPFQGNVGSGDLLSVFLYQDNPSAPGTKYVFSGYAAAEANYSGLTATNEPSPQTLFLVQFLDGAGTVISSNALDLVSAGLPTGGPSTMALFQMPELTAPANTATVRAGAAMLNVYSTSGQQSFFVDAFSLDAATAGDAPVLETEPEDASVAPGARATFTVKVASPAVGVTYQWQHLRANLTDGGNIAGATTPTLTIANVSPAEVGRYRVLVRNNAGAVFSREVSLSTLAVTWSPVVWIAGRVGDTYRIDYATSLAPTTWLPLSTNKLVTTPQSFVDGDWQQSQARYYRTVFVP